MSVQGTMSVRGNRECAGDYEYAGKLRVCRGAVSVQETMSVQGSQKWTGELKVSLDPWGHGVSSSGSPAPVYGYIRNNPGKIQ